MPASSTSLAVGKSYAVTIAIRVPSACSRRMSLTVRRATDGLGALIGRVPRACPECAPPRPGRPTSLRPGRGCDPRPPLAEQRKRLATAIGVEDLDPVGVGPEAGARLGDVVRDEQVDPLAPELLRGAVEVAGLGGEAH